MLFDKESPRSIASLLPDSLSRLLHKIWESDDAFLIGLPEHELYLELVRRGKVPGATDNILRFQFWLEFERTQTEEARDPKLNMSTVLGNTIPKETFYKFYITQPEKFAWFLCPPIEHINRIEEAFIFSIKRLRDAIEYDGFTNPSDRVRHYNWILQVNKDLYYRIMSYKGAKLSKGPVPKSGDDEKKAQLQVPPEKQKTQVEIAKERLEVLRSEKMPDLGLGSTGGDS